MAVATLGRLSPCIPGLRFVSTPMLRRVTIPSPNFHRKMSFGKSDACSHEISGESHSGWHYKNISNRNAKPLVDPRTRKWSVSLKYHFLSGHARNASNIREVFAASKYMQDDYQQPRAEDVLAVPHRFQELDLPQCTYLPGDNGKPISPDNGQDSTVNGVNTGVTYSISNNVQEKFDGLYEKICIVDNAETAKMVVGKLMGEYKELIHACDTEVWHKYSFDKHIIENHGINVNGFYADTMHLARLWNSARCEEGGYSLEALTKDPKVMDGAGAESEDELTTVKKSMEAIFGKRKVKKDGTEVKVKTVAAVEELQRTEHKPWVCYSASDSISTLRLWKSLRAKLEKKIGYFKGLKSAACMIFMKIIGVLLVTYWCKWSLRGCWLTVSIYSRNRKNCCQRARYCWFLVRMGF